MTNKGKEAYRAYQKSKNETKQAIRDRRNPSYRSYYEQIFNFKIYNSDTFSLLPETRFNYPITTTFSINYF